METKFKIGEIYRYNYTANYENKNIKIGDYFIFQVLDYVEDCRELSRKMKLERTYSQSKGILYKKLEGKMYRPTADDIGLFTDESDIFGEAINWDRYEIEQDIKETFNG